MRKRAFAPFKALAVTALSLSAAASLAAFDASEPAPAPDPAAVERYLAELEASQAAGVPAEKERKPAGRGESLRKIVEGAAVRAPSGSVVNGIEAKLAEKLG